MENRLAVIDLGTNTFHILIAEANGSGGFKEIVRYRQFIKLAEEGIEKIGDAPFQRGLAALQYFSLLMQEEKVSKIKAFGTAALRTASNGQDFIKAAKETTGIDIQLISGDEEARLIYKGVNQAVPPAPERMLIMDIGGGSVEFIIADHSTIYWAQSFPIGVAVLFNRFHHSSPIKKEEITMVEDFLKDHLSPLEAALRQFPCRKLVGASGTFDVLEALVVKEKDNPIYSHFDAQLFFPLYEELIQTSLEERYEMESIPASRAEMIIVAVILIKYVLELGQIPFISVSAYAMKEGILVEMLEEI